MTKQIFLNLNNTAQNSVLNMMLFLFFCLWAVSFRLDAQAENLLEDDLLAGEVFEFESQQDLEPLPFWRRNIRITIQQTLSQGNKLEISRTETRIEYEVAPWDGGYLRLDNKYTYYSNDDQQLKDTGNSFGHNKLQEAWLQVSESACVSKIGRQGLYWGVVEGAFAVDVISPFDFTEPLLTDYSNIRLSQDMFLLDCYYSNTQFQSFYVESARLNTFKLKKTSQFDDLENALHEEFGGRISQSWEGGDVSFMYAHLYENTPVSIIDFNKPNGIRLDVSRYELWGLSTSWAIGRLLLELDWAYKNKQLENFSGKKLSHSEAAVGIEYTTFNNHQLNAGVWLYDQVIQEPNAKSSRVQSWTIGWSKTYLNDDLMLSFLGFWVTEPEVLTATALAQYQWDDFWDFSTALTYTDADGATQSVSLNESELTLLLKLRFQI